MLNVNGRISRNASCVDTTWLGRSLLNVEEVFNWLFSGEGKCWLESHAIKQGWITWEQWAGVWKGKCFWLKDRSSKSERRYWLVVRLKAIKYKENFFCYLSSTTSLFYSLWIPTDPLHYFPRLPVIWSTYDWAHSCDGYLIESSSRVLYFIPYWTI